MIEYLLYSHMLQFKHAVVLLSDAFLSTLTDYEIVTPARVARDGSHVTFSLHPGHELHKRSASDDNDYLHYSVDINKKRYVLELAPYKHLVSPGLVIERRKNRFNNVTDSTFEYLHESKTNCHLHGRVVNETATKVAVRLCDGMVSLIYNLKIFLFAILLPVHTHYVVPATRCTSDTL